MGGSRDRGSPGGRTDRAVQKSNLWLKELGAELHMDDVHDTHLSLRAVLHALRDRLRPDQAGARCRAAADAPGPGSPADLVPTELFALRDLVREQSESLGS